MSVSVCDWYRRTIVTPCLLVFSTVWNTLFPCIFRQIETPCLPAFPGRLKHLVSFHFPSGSNVLFQTYCYLEYFGRLKHFVSLCFQQLETHLFPCIFRQIETPCFPAFSGRLKHLVSFHFPSGSNVLFQTYCYLEYFGRLKHFVSLYFPADSNMLFPCISGVFKHLRFLIFLTGWNLL